MLHEKDLRDNLLSAEPLSPQRQQRFREELAQIVEPRLSRGYRLYYIVTLCCAVSGLPGAACGIAFDAPHRRIWALSLLAFTALAGWILHILRRGAEPLSAMQGMSKAMAGISVVVAGSLIYHGLQRPSLAGILWAMLGVLLFLLTSSINQWNRVIMAERTMREHLLRVEYRLAELATRETPIKP